MSEVDVNAGTLREAGESLSDFQGKLFERNNAHLLHGTGDHMSISTGGFFPGTLAQTHLSKHPPDAYTLIMELGGDLLALSSALHIVADVYETADHEQAMEFAFLNPDAKVPSGLPPDINGEVTVGGTPKGGEGGETSAPPGQVPDGGSRHQYLVRSPDKSNDGSTTWVTEIRDADGNLVSRTQHTTRPDGGYAVSYYNGDNQLLRQEHKQITSDGGTLYYTDVYDRNGNAERQDIIRFGDQPRPVAHGEALQWMVDEGIEKSDEELKRHGFDPDGS